MASGDRYAGPTVISVWSTKGGVGVSTVCALLAAAGAGRGERVRLIDLCGDLPAVVGTPDPTGPGVVEWSSTPGREVAALDRITVPIAPDIELIARGSGSFGASAGPLIRAIQRSEAAHQIIDCGLLGGPDTGFRSEVAAGVPHRLVVVRPCYLCLRRARRLPVEPTGVIIVNEARRSIARCDVEAVIEAPVVAEIALDPDIARAVDAGVVLTRAPRRLLRALAGIVTAGPESMVHRV